MDMLKSVNPDIYFKLIPFAEKWYPPKKFQHANRVASYAYLESKENPFINPIEAATVGLAHDLLEDTDAPPEELQHIIGGELTSDVLLLTKDENTSYKDYIQEIIDNKDKQPIAFLVKRADMKDHLTLTTTLTDKLKDKYFPVIHYFL